MICRFETPDRQTMFADAAADLARSMDLDFGACQPWIFECTSTELALVC